MRPEHKYWDIGARNVPDMTGARAVLDAHDLRALFEHFALDVPLPGLTLDVGCGTGRAAPLCEQWVGVDVSPSAVEYCRQQGREAFLLEGWAQNEKIAEIARAGGAQQILCISVFTHIPRSERIYYLQCFRQLAPRLVVDIIPGNGSGEIALWTAKPEDMELDLRAAGWLQRAWTTQAWEAAGVPPPPHRYYYAEAA